MIKINRDHNALNHLKRKYAKSIEDSYYTKDNLYNEIWEKLIFDFEEKMIQSKRYIISNYGRIKNVESDKFVKPWKDKDGYAQIYVCEPGYDKLPRKVHRLVAFVFIPNINNYPQINHKRYGDEFKDFNHVDNLEWSNNSQNQKHKYNSLGKEVFTIEELFKIKELLQVEGWTINSILENLGYDRDKSKAQCLKRIHEGVDHKDIFSDIKIAKRGEKFLNTKEEDVHEICKCIKNKMKIVDIAKLFDVGKHVINGIKAKRNHKKISDLYFKRENGKIIPL